jgi:hypothetical protein
MTKRLWDPCVAHGAGASEDFLRKFFADKGRAAVIIAGAGFDPRSTRATELLAGVLAARLRGIFLREERSGVQSAMSAMADANTQRLIELVPRSRVAPFPVFSTDNATVGGRRTVEALKSETWADVTDIVVDLSALSVGVAFPLVRLLLDVARKHHRNLHVVVTDDPSIDDEIDGISSEKAETLFSFKGELGLHDTSDVTILWLPQLTARRRKALGRVHATLTEDQEVDVCPLLPFPARDPRRGDRLIEVFQDEFESVWRVDARDLIYVDERKPVDLYRSVLDIDDARRRVFRELGGSVTVLSPFGSKVQSLGALMAALERDFPVMYVETLTYTSAPFVDSEGELVHVWLHGEAYGQEVDAAVSKESEK